MHDKRVSAEEIKRVLAGDFDRLAQELADAMNAAKAGHIIADTEEPVRDAHAEFRQRAFEKAQSWHEDMMTIVWDQGSLVMLHRLEPYLRHHRTGLKNEALAALRQYVGKRVNMTDYPTFRQMGYDCGSGPTESQCGTLTRVRVCDGTRTTPRA